MYDLLKAYGVNDNSERCIQTWHNDRGKVSGGWAFNEKADGDLSYDLEPFLIVHSSSSFAKTK